MHGGMIRASWPLNIMQKLAAASGQCLSITSALSGQLLQYWHTATQAQTDMQGATSVSLHTSKGRSGAGSWVAHNIDGILDREWEATQGAHILTSLSTVIDCSCSIHGLQQRRIES